MSKSALLLLIFTLGLSLLTACGQKETPAPVALPAVAPVAATPAPAEENTIGKSTYNKICSLCHAASVAGSPKPGDKADWAPRIAQGMDMLNKHALEGFTGAKGMMPARGGSATLTDDEVKAAVAYMVEKSR